MFQRGFQREDRETLMHTNHCAPEGEIPIQWYHLPTLPIDTDEEVSAVIEYVCNRLQIVIYFRTLKSGCKIEERYVERITRLEN